MPTLNRSRPGIWSVTIAIALLLLSLGAGWWLGHRRGSTAGDDPRQAVLARQADQLRLRLDRQEASDSDKQRLLELLVGLDRKEEAILVLEPMADQEPDRWSLRLMLAELRRDRNDRAGAERELRLILNRKPDQVEALQLMTLIKLEQGRGSQAETQVKAAYMAAAKAPVQPEAMALGLLLAELQQRRQQLREAETTYQGLAAEFPNDQRPLLGLALLRHDQGNIKGAQEALANARLRSLEPDKPDPRLDRLAASWGLGPLRAPSSRSSPPKPGVPTPPAPIGPQSP